MPKIKFLRRIWKRHSKLGKQRKKKQVWRKPKGRDNKMREKRKGHPSIVSIGYKKNKTSRGKIREKSAIIARNIKDLNKAGKENIIIIGNVGQKKRIEIAKKAKEMKFEVRNMNIENFLKKLNKKNKESSKKTEESKKWIYQRKKNLLQEL